MWDRNWPAWPSRTAGLYSDLVHRSEFDLLTDIHNRFSLDKQLEASIARAREDASIFGLIYIDLDEFKQVNDVYGHRVGDLYLQEVAGRMKRQLRTADLLARVGGDEFVVLVPMVHSRADVEEIASRLESCFDAPFQAEGYVAARVCKRGHRALPGRWIDQGQPVERRRRSDVRGQACEARRSRP